MEKVKQALEAVQHIYLCEDEGMASGQPTKEDYLQARELVAAALAELEGSKPKPQDPSAREKALEKTGDAMAIELVKSREASLHSPYRETLAALAEAWWMIVPPSLSAEASRAYLLLNGIDPDKEAEYGRKAIEKLRAEMTAAKSTK